jgi:NitT/TauT family transport system permease protein
MRLLRDIVAGLPAYLWSGWGAAASLALALTVGGALGLLAGRFVTTAVIARPLLTLLLGMPPIAWLALAMLWFGAGHATPVFTVFVATMPIVFAGALQGMRTLEGQMRELAAAYRLPAAHRFTDLVLPHVGSYLFPAAITALGTAWKVVVMAELLTTVDGVGAPLAASRTQLDTATSLAWISALVALLLAIE